METTSIKKPANTFVRHLILKDEMSVLKPSPLSFPKQIRDFLKSIPKKDYYITSDFKVNLTITDADGLSKTITHKVPHVIEFYSEVSFNLFLLVFDKWYEPEPPNVSYR